MEAPIKFDSALIRRLLEERYSPEKGYETFHEVADRTAGANRFMDTLVFSSWPSLGNCAWGFEIKVSRSDLLSELKNPAKASGMIGYCRYWYLAVAPGIIDLEKDVIPPGWGVLEATRDGKGLREVRKPEKRDDSVLDGIRPFLASFLRSVRKTRDSKDWIHVSEVDRRILDQAEGRVKLEMVKYDKRIETLERHLKDANESIKNSQRLLKELEEAFGMKLPNPDYRFELNPFLQTLKLLRAHGSDRIVASFRQQHGVISGMLARLDEMLGELEDARETK